MSAFGIDISSYQPADATLPGTCFTAVKATEGTTYTNPEYGQQLAAARSRGNVVIHYHFLHPGNISAQVAYFLSVVQLQAGDVLAVDWEICEDGSRATAGEKEFFLESLPAGHRRIVYMNRDFLDNYDVGNYHADGLWIADPGAPAGRPAISEPWVFHQYGQTNGIDTDVFNGTEDELRAWAGAPSIAPAWPGRYLRLTSPHMTGQDVQTWQARMVDRGWNLGPTGADGDFGAITDGVARAFQEEKGLTVDGIVGPATWAAAWTAPIT
jgi:GH25 family lysozyme M1 (1,4-beta-N-acetylmuramidase)